MDLIFLSLCILCIIVILKGIPIMHRQYIIWNKVKGLPQNGYPFIGNSIALMKMSDKERIDWALSLNDTFKEGIALNWIAGIPFVFVFKPEFVQIILNSTVNLEKGVTYKLFNAVAGEGLVTSTTTQWLHDRKLIGPTYHMNILNQYAIIMSRKTEILMKCLEKEIGRNPGKPIDIFPLIVKATLDIACETSMGVNTHAQEVESNYIATINRLFVLTFERIFRPWYWIDWLYFLMPIGIKYKSAVNIIHRFTTEIINKKKIMRQSQNNSVSLKTEDGFDIGTREKRIFLDMLLDENEKTDSPLNDDHIRAQVLTFILASQDTTAVAITWTLFLLGNNLEHQEKVHEELENIFQNSEAPANENELSQLKYLDRVIKETLRLYPSVPVILRNLMEDVKLGDYTIPRNVEVALPIATIHRNPKFWPDPTKFDPDRFLPKNSKDRNRYTYIPFSAGPRNCIGQKFGLLEMKTILAAILRKWKVKSVKTPDTIRCCASIIYHPVDEVLLYFTPKK